MTEHSPSFRKGVLAQGAASAGFLASATGADNVRLDPVRAGGGDGMLSACLHIAPMRR
jgi:hypothetical protein